MVVNTEGLGQARILVVDDEESNIALIKHILSAVGLDDVFATTDPRQALSLFTECKPDLVVLDLIMPYLDGYKLLRQLGSRVPEGSYLPLLVITGDGTPETRQKVLAAGAKDFLTKPFDAIEVVLRIKNLLETRVLYLRLEDHNRELEQRVGERTRELEETQTEILERLAAAAEYRDEGTGLHTRRVGKLSALLARMIGLGDGQSQLIRKAAVLHDLGKISVPDTILGKPGQLLAEEFDMVRPHTTVGAGILSGSRSRLLQLAEEIALYHHERWDGAGYSRLAGESIPLPARIVALADAFDVITHDRPYRSALPIADAVAEIQRESGKQFEPRLVDALLALLREEGLAALDE
jgi:putative two-component system response regulator